MKYITLSLLCAGLITASAIAEDICGGAYQAQNYAQAAECYVKQLKKERTFYNLESAGVSYAQLGRYKEALPYLKEAEKKAQTPTDYRILYSWLGLVYGDLGDATKELAYKMKFLDLSLKSGIRGDTGKGYNNLGWYYYSQNEPQKALDYYEKALEYQDELKSSSTYGNMAIAYNTLQDPIKAEEMYQKSVAIDQKSGDYHSLGDHKTQLGVFYFMQARNSEARTTLEDALVINRNSGNINSESHALSILAVIDYREGHVNEAKEKAAEALRLAKQSGDRGAVLRDAQRAWNFVNEK
jgi:tetratricopeptide (TPR) repeat protein